jgi:hypothetical protein
MSEEVVGSSTIRLSRGDLPFFEPESTARAPEVVMAELGSLVRQCS